MNFENIPLTIAAFVAVTSFVLLMVMIFSSGQRAMAARIVDLVRPERDAGKTSDRGRESALPSLGAMLMPDDETKVSRLRTRLQQAGLYRRHSSAVYLGVKFLCMVVPIFVGLALAAAQVFTFLWGILIGIIVGLLGSILPSLWLSRRKSARQKIMRRSLPDALDVIVICLEGGLSLPAAFARVASELHDAHPLLASEMAIVQREIQLGRSTGDALTQFADRFDAEELRGLASVIVQAERFGASIVKALRVHADTLREKRHRYAEEQAQKAPVKLIFPTVLCIFPALYVVLMGPAAVRLLEMLDSMTF